MRRVEAFTQLAASARARDHHRQTLCMCRTDIVWCQSTTSFFFEAQRKYTRVVLRSYEGLLRMGISASGIARPQNVLADSSRHDCQCSSRCECSARAVDMTVMLDGRQERCMSRDRASMFRDGFV